MNVEKETVVINDKQYSFQREENRNATHDRDVLETFTFSVECIDTKESHYMTFGITTQSRNNLKALSDGEKTKNVRNYLIEAIRAGKFYEGHRETISI